MTDIAHLGKGVQPLCVCVVGGLGGRVCGYGDVGGWVGGGEGEASRACIPYPRASFEPLFICLKEINRRYDLLATRARGLDLSKRGPARQLPVGNWHLSPGFVIYMPPRPRQGRESITHHPFEH
jgi:hypothetical protein